jgi:MoaA/NifB/PqqE/SkfB family radical SAM enzyme
MAVTFAQIEPTTRCNFTCGFCVGRRMAQGDLDWATFEAFLAAHPDLRHVELQGEGEPMLHPRFFDMVEACGARGIRVSMITNGSLLNAERVERLIDSGVSSVHVSLESSDPEQFRAIRGGLFSKVEAGLRLLMERRRQRGASEPKLGFAVTVLKDTIHAFPAIRRLYDDLGLDGGISVQPLQSMADYAQGYGAAMVEQVVPAELRPNIRAIRASAQEAEPMGVDSFYAALFAGFDPARHGCPWLERGAYLGMSGSIAPCCFVKRPEAAFGRVGHDPPGAITDRRTAANAELLRGGTPASCRGCGTAAAVAAAGRTRLASRFSLNAPVLANLR